MPAIPSHEKLQNTGRKRAPPRASRGALKLGACWQAFCPASKGLEGWWQAPALECRHFSVEGQAQPCGKAPGSCPSELIGNAGLVLPLPSWPWWDVSQGRGQWKIRAGLPRGPPDPGTARALPGKGGIWWTQLQQGCGGRKAGRGAQHHPKVQLGDWEWKRAALTKGEEWNHTQRGERMGISDESVFVPHSWSSKGVGTVKVES